MIVRTTPPQRWAIAGGGMLGLTLAWRLSRAGHDVTLIEAAPDFGGLASVWKVGEAVWDKHYHVILLSDTRLRNLLEEIGLTDQLNWVETKTGFYTDGQLYPMSDTREFLRFPPLNLIEKLRLGGTIFYASRIRNWKRLEKIEVGRWLRRWSGRGTFEKIWLPLLRAKLGEAWKQTAASFIWAHINRMYSARRTGLKKEMFGYVNGGYRTIINRMVDRLREEGVNLLSGHVIQEVRRVPGGPLRIRFASQPDMDFDQVVMTTPSSIIARTCPELNDEERGKLESVQYLGIVNASVLLKKGLTSWYVTNITDENIPMTAVIEMTNIVDKSHFNGSSLIYLPKYLPPGHPMYEVPDDEIREQFLAALERMHPGFSRDDVEAFQVARVRTVMAIPVLRYSENLPDQRTSVPGLYIVNSSFITRGNLNVNETIQIAEEALETTLRDAMNACAHHAEQVASPTA